MHERLNEFNRKLAANELDIPPEGQRSPSPPPVYDTNGVRLNTREIRYREKLTDRRNRLVEDLLKEDPNFKPPADYRPRRYHKKILIPQARGNGALIVDSPVELRRGRDARQARGGCGTSAACTICMSMALQPYATTVHGAVGTGHIFPTCLLV